MEAAKVLIVDDHALFRHGVRTAIERAADLQVVGEATDGGEALAKARQLHPDLILMDISMPRCSGLEAVRAIKCELPGTKVIMLTVHCDRANLLEAIKSGAEGFLSKSVRAEVLLASLRAALRGEAAISQKLAVHVLQEFARLAQIEARQVNEQLTIREKQVLAQLSQGLSNREIAESLYISENTVKAHVGHILKKLHVHSRSEAAAYAQRLALASRRDRIA
jgi:two-component system NarL family response regulator